MVPPCLAGARRGSGAAACCLATARFVGAATLAGVAAALLAQTVAATYLNVLGGPCDAGQTIAQTDSRCIDSYSFFGGVQVERIVMVAMVSTGITLSLARMVILAWRVLRAIRRRCEARLEARLAEALWRAGAALLGQGEEARVWRQANKQRVRQARVCLHMVSLAVLPSVFFSSLALFNPKATQPQPDRGFILQYLFHSEGPPIIFLAVIGAVADAAPSFVTPTNLNYTNVFFSNFLAWRYMVMGNKWYLYNHTWMLVMRSVQGIVCGNARLTILLQGIITGVEVAAITMKEVTDFSMYWTISRDVSILFVISILSWTFEQRQLAEARATLRSFRSDRAVQLVQRLLSGMCEAVVRLDGQLCIAEPSPRLSSLLLRQGPLAPGLGFTDLMPAEDAKRVRVRLEAEAKEQAMAEIYEGSEEECASNDPRPAQVLHVHLNDGSGAKLPVELFYSCLPDVDGQPSFLVGIKEDREGQAPLEERVEALPESTPHQVSEQVRLAALPEDRRVDCRSQGSWSLSEACAALQVCLDAETPELKVLSGSSDFALLGGAAGPCSQLRDWLSAEDFSRLSAWLALAQPDSPDPGCTVKLQPPTCKGSYKVCCTLHTVPASLARAGSKPVCVLFEHPTFKPRLSRNDESQAVDRVMCEAQQRQQAASSSASSSTARSSSNREDWTLLWFTVCSRRLKILEIAGGAAAPHHGKFARKKHFTDWLERPSDFVDVLKSALVDHEIGLREDMPRNLGRFILTQPGTTEVDRCRFLAKLFLVEISDDESADYPCCVGVKPLRDLPLRVAFDRNPGNEINASL